MLHLPKRLIYLLFGHLFFLLGIIGAFIPLLPTTPFLILACFCYSRASSSMHQYLLKLAFFGPQLNEWEKFGIIRTKAKIAAVASIILIFGSSIYFVQAPDWAKMSMILLACILILFILSRPSV